MQGCGAEHLLIGLWDRIMEGLEGGKNAAVLLGVDFEKAFNQMEQDECLKQLQLHGASEGSLNLVAAFLKERAMMIKIDGYAATSVPITRGGPQGSVLGCLLYCITTQSLTSNLNERVRPHMRNAERDAPAAPRERERLAVRDAAVHRPLLPPIL